MKIRGKRRRAAAVTFFNRVRADYRRRRVAETFIGSGKRRIRISTVRLHGIHELDLPAEIAEIADRLPDAWETMVIGGPLDDLLWRYNGRREAQAGHRQVVQLVRLAIDTARTARTKRQRHRTTYGRRHRMAFA